MIDFKDIITNIEQIYGSNNSLNLLKDFERVIDELDLYVFDNWIDGELVEGPRESRYHIECSFMWPMDEMPDPKGAARLLDYGCRVKVKETNLNKVRRIKNPDDIRPGTRKGKIDQIPVIIIKISMPKKLMADIQRGYMNLDQNKVEDILTQNHISSQQINPAEQQAQETPDEQPVPAA
jgi:hypothetical protein